MDKKKSFMEKKSTSIVLSVTSLVLIMCLLFVATYSWVGKSNEDNVDVNELSLNLDTGLDSKWEGSETSNSINISEFELREVSSANGRDFFVPDDSFNEVNADSKVSTDELRFRKANASDIYNGVNGKGTNKKFLQVSFSLSTEVNTDTPVYMSGLSSITGTGSQYVRMSIDSHDKGEDPVVFSNQALKGEESESTLTNAVASIDTTGVATLGNQVSHALDAYTYTNDSEDTSLFTIKSGETKMITLSIWLEGASGDFPRSIVNKNDLDISVILTTKKDYTNTLVVMDRTIGTWLSSSESNLFVINATDYNLDKPLDQLDYYTMKLDSTGTKWTATIPQGFSQVYLRRYSSTSSSTSWDYWGPLTIPGAEKLNLQGTDEEKKTGLTRTYNILGDENEGTKNGVTYPADVNSNYDAGLWGEFSDSDFAEMKMFDQYSVSYSDEYGKFGYNNSSSGTNNKYIPYVNMQVKYSPYSGNFGGGEITTKLRYRMYLQSVNDRYFAANVFTKTSGVTVSSAGIVPYKATSTASAGALASFGSSWQTNLSTTPYFAYTGSSGTCYWGKDIIYLNNKPSDNAYCDQNTDIYYAVYFRNSAGTTKEWKIMSKWSSKNGYYAVVAPSYTSKLSIHRVRCGSSSTNSAQWTNHTDGSKRLNWSDVFTYSSSKNLFSLNSFATMKCYLEDYYDEGQSKMHCYAWYGSGTKVYNMTDYPGWGMGDSGLTSSGKHKLYYNDLPGYTEYVVYSSYSYNEHWKTTDITLDGLKNSFYYDGTLHPYDTDTKTDDNTGYNTFRPKINITNSNDASLP